MGGHYPLGKGNDRECTRAVWPKNLIYAEKENGERIHKRTDSLVPNVNVFPLSARFTVIKHVIRFTEIKFVKVCGRV